MNEPRDENRGAHNGDDEDPTERRGHDYVPEGVERRTGLWPTLKRTVAEFQEDNLTDWAAALTYYGKGRTTGCWRCSQR